MIGPTNAMTVTGTVDPQGVTVGSDTKPVKIVNGVATMVANDLVDTVTAQTIGGAKNFSGSCTFTDNRIRLANDNDKYLNIRKADNTTDTHSISFFNTGLIALYPGLESGKTKAVVIGSQRGYDASHTTDIVTIGTLQASTDVVHTVGNEYINGFKKISDSLIGINNVSRVTSTVCMDIAQIDVTDLATGTGIYLSVLFTSRFEVGLAHISCTLSSGAVSTINVGAIGVYKLSNTRYTKFGARVSNNKLIFSVTTTTGNSNLGADVLNINLDGMVATTDYSVYGTTNTKSSLTGYVQES